MNNSAKLVSPIAEDQIDNDLQSQSQPNSNSVYVGNVLVQPRGNQYQVAADGNKRMLLNPLLPISMDKKQQSNAFRSRGGSNNQSAKSHNERPPELDKKDGDALPHLLAY